MSYICPICKNTLALNAWGNAYRCENNHSFDLAKDGYVNLLPVQKKHSKDPGDTKEMIGARHEFLASGFYDQMAENLVETIQSTILDSQGKRILDLGCGEGFYSRQLKVGISDSEQIELHGLDIAKDAIILASKKQKDSKFVVASSNDLPFPDHYFDLVYRVYAPSNDSELFRVIKPSGHLLIVTPGPRHLWQLKEMIYEEAREHNSEGIEPTGFKQVKSLQKSYTIKPDQELRMSLLQMTPFAWQTTEKVKKEIYDKDNFEIEVDFIFSLYQKLS